MNTPPDQEIRYRLLKLLSKGEALSQREMAGRIKASLGRINRTLTDFRRRGLIVVEQSQVSQCRVQYLYELTAAGLEETKRLGKNFLKAKLAEYENVKRQIRELIKEVNQ